MLDFLSRHQVASYLAALIAGSLMSFLLEGTPLLSLTEALTLPALAVLLWTTFMAVPLVGISREDLPGRFVVRLLLLNFVLVPAIIICILVLARLIRLDAPEALIFVAVLVLLAPCIDYVVVFTGISGGNSQRLLLATPLLLAFQLVFIPFWLYILKALGLLEVPVSVQALLASLPDVAVALSALVIPLILAWGIQKFARSKPKRTAENIAEKSMDVVMCAVLFLTATIYTAKVAEYLTLLLPLALLYMLFAVIAGALSRAGSHGFGRADRIALTFSPTTRNALVILPVVLAIASAQAEAQLVALMPLAVVTQTLIELLIMLALTRIFTRT